ncbi:MAG: hypothetical protein MR967_03765 [Holdemanella sp.]|uniref:hypothetical protein n=1 Tax=Holdemanella sp. TaxID=1971762 RepID=UPI002583FB64|nr:hypothetical protein [Holdemanella sp.]MCI7166042.1 hypothetical protein [Holdemanella sp.]
MRKKKFIAMALVAMLSLSGLTGCSDKDKADISNKLNNKTTETTKKDDSKADDKTSESKPDNKSDNKSDNKKSDSNSSSDKPANKPSSGNNGSASKPNSNKPADKPAKPNGNTGSNKPSNSSTSKPSQSTEKPAETKPSQPAHQHTWVDHTATKKVPRTVHHDAVYEDVTIPAVTQIQYQCLGCGKWFSSLNDLTNHAFAVQIGAESGDPARCGSGSTDAQREVVITPAYTEHRLVKDAWDETVEDIQTYVDYQECTGCHEHRQK